MLTRVQEAAASSALLALLETRETAMRLTPLHLLMVLGKNLNFGRPSDDTLSRNQIQVAEILLSYGARPSAKDVCGKTVCHYGAGAMATETTMEIVEKAAISDLSSKFFNQEIELHGLDKVEMNGRRGIARGFRFANERRVMFLENEPDPLAIKPKNLRLTGTAGDGPWLPDIQCRLGITSILEAVQSGRADVAKFLTSRLKASIDISDCDGVSARSMALAPMSEMMSAAATVIKDVVGRQGRKDLKIKRDSCANGCGAVGADFKRCSKCRCVVYCSRECQGSSLNHIPHVGF